MAGRRIEQEWAPNDARGSDRSVLELDRNCRRRLGKELRGAVDYGSGFVVSSCRLLLRACRTSINKKKTSQELSG